MRIITATTGAAALVALAVAGCGTVHGGASGTPTPKASATAPVSPSVSANPFANWSSTCITLVNELQSSPYDFSYTTSGTTINWNMPSTLTYGQLGNLGSGTRGNKNDLAHLSYLATTVDSSSQLGNDLGDAGMATINPADGIVPQTVNGVSIYNNSAYHQLQREQVSASNLSTWVNNYLLPVLNDCSAGD
jgi:hypothetical protein